MYELEDGKDQMMTVLKLTLANLAMWVRDRFFPPEYAHATWQRLSPFLGLPGRVAWQPQTVSVELRAFNDRRLNQDLAELCERVNGARLRSSGGRTLLLRTELTDRHRPTAWKRRAA